MSFLLKMVCVENVMLEFMVVKKFNYVKESSVAFAMATSAMTGSKDKYIGSGYMVFVIKYELMDVNIGLSVLMVCVNDIVIVVNEIFVK